MNILIKNIGELLTCSPLAREKRAHSISMSDLGRIKDAWLFVSDGKIADFGQGLPPNEIMTGNSVKIIDAEKKLILPGLVDAHTHPLFAGARFQEFSMRLDGKSYQEIASQGGGIQASVEATRIASATTLSHKLQDSLNKFLEFGITTIEVKSGYGLSVQEELRHLQILKDAKSQCKQQLITTCLALHAVPSEYKSSHDYIKVITQELLPLVAERELAQYVDAFIENGYFSAAECEGYFQQAKHLGLKIRIHADEFSDSGAAVTAALYGAASADHLQFANQKGIQAMAEAGVIATVLPGTSLYTAIPFTDASRFTQAKCGVAIATDFNPGSCGIFNLPMLASLAGLHCHLNTAEVIAGVTYAPAKSLDLGAQKGALIQGFDADFLMHPASCIEEWLADMGQTMPDQVWIDGELAHAKVRN